MVGLVTQRDRPRLVLADRLQYLAERRVDGAVDQEEAAEETGQYDVIEHRRLGEIEDPEQIALRNTLDAVFAMGERRLQVDEEKQLRQRQRDHREIDALPADRDEAGDDGKRRGAGDTDQDSKLGRHAPDLERMRRAIARGA